VFLQQGVGCEIFRWWEREKTGFHRKIINFEDLQNLHDLDEESVRVV